MKKITSPQENTLRQTEKSAGDKSLSGAKTAWSMDSFIVLRVAASRTARFLSLKINQNHQGVWTWSDMCNMERALLERDSSNQYFATWPRPTTEAGYISLYF